MLEFSGTGITIRGTVKFNSIVWIHSLPADEFGPTGRILEDLAQLAAASSIALKVYSVDGREKFRSVMAEITADAQAGLRPILHVDAHGNADAGIYLAPSGEWMGWEEVLNLLRAMNVATENNLVCVFVLCYGLNLYKLVRLGRATPAYLFAAPEAEVTVGFLLEQTLKFYQETIATGNVTSALASTLAGSMRSFHCQGLFFQALLRYIRQHGSRKRRNDRTEELLTKSIRNGSIGRDVLQLRGARKRIRELLQPSQRMVDRFAQTFLVGRRADFTYADIERGLRRNRRPA